MASEVNNVCRSPRKRYTFLLSSFTNEEKQSLSTKIAALGGTYVDTPHFVISCTHVICSKPNRGEKFLCGCATGKWILNSDYIEDSYKASHWLNEQPYEWNNRLGIPNLSPSHISAPMRWRQAVERDKGPFCTWKVLVVVGDAKRRVAYKRLLDAGCATLLTGKRPYPPKLAKKLTHVFVEKALEADVQEFSNAGIPCLSPDFIPEYILQDPKPSMDAFAISTYTHLSVACQPSRTGPKDTPVLPLGKSGIPKTQSRIQELIAKCPMKRPAEVTCDDSSPTKKQKQDVSTENAYPDWLDLSINNPAAMDVDLTKSAPTANKTATNRQAFPPHISDAVGSYLEESHKRSALSMVESFLSHSRHPNSWLLYTLMNKLLLRSSSPSQSNKAYLCLQRLLLLHPPSVKSSLYLSAMSPPDEASNSQVVKRSNEWAFLSDVIRISLGHKEGIQTPIEGTPPRHLKDNGLLTLKFLVCLLEKDFTVITENGKSQSNVQSHQFDKSLIWKIIWPNGMGAAINSNVRSLLKLTWAAAAQESQDEHHKVPVLLLLHSLVAMVASCCQAADKETSVGPNSSGALLIGMRMASLATEMILTCGRCHEHEGDLRLFLDTCRPSWLKMKVTETMLNNYDDCLIPQQSKHLLTTGLSLEKIISCYFYLIPRETRGDVTDNTDESTQSETLTTSRKGRERRNTALRVIAHANTSKGHELRGDPTKKSRNPAVNRRNVRGETPLHVACIRKDAVKVRDLIAHGADVNLEDNAGWTPLHEACNHGHVGCVEEILKVRPLIYDNDHRKGVTGLYILSSPKCGTTALHDAVGNGHLEVARLLVNAGGLPLLEAKNATGLKPADVAVNCAMKQYLTGTQRNLRNKTDISNCTITEQSTSHQPSSDMYIRALGRKGRHASRYIAPEKCHQYLLILSHLLKSFMQVYHSRCLDDSTLSNLRSHISRIISQDQLTPLCNIRLEGMTML